MKFTESSQDEASEIDSGDSSDFVPSSVSSDTEDDLDECRNKISLQSFSGIDTDDKGMFKI